MHVMNLEQAVFEQRTEPVRVSQGVDPPSVTFCPMSVLKKFTGKF